jgi:hypothetical protein
VDVPAIISVLDDHGFTDTDSSTKVEAIQAAIWDIEAREPWPFLETSLNLNFDGSSATPSNWPTNFRAALKLFDRTIGRRVPPMRLDDADEYIGDADTETGDPVFYYFEGGTLKVWRIPASATGRLRFRYLRVSDAIASDSAESAILLPPRHHELIVFRTLMRLYDMEDDPELAARFEGHYEAKLERVKNDLIRQQYDQPDYVHIFDVDDWDFDQL